MTYYFRGKFTTKNFARSCSSRFLYKVVQKTSETSRKIQKLKANGKQHTEAVLLTKMYKKTQMCLF